MPTYFSLINYTDQGIRNVKDSPQRLDAAKKLITDMGGELKGFYLTMGPYDLIAILEAPDDEVVAKVLLALGSAGNVRTITLKAFPEADFRRVIEALP
jgi:uncharacterized protein with GYD domain